MREPVGVGVGVVTLRALEAGGPACVKRFARCTSTSTTPRIWSPNRLFQAARRAMAAGNLKPQVQLRLALHLLTLLELEAGVSIP